MKRLLIISALAVAAAYSSPLGHPRPTAENVLANADHAASKVSSRAPHHGTTGSLEHVSTVQTRRGPLERYEQRVDGIRVLGGEVVVRRAHDGTEVWRSGEAKTVGAVEFALTPDEAADRLETDRAALSIEPIIWAIGSRAPRAAYRIVSAPSDDQRQQWRSTVDATSGRLIGRQNLVHTARGDVFEVDPLTTPTPVSVDLPVSGDALANDRFVLGNCTDNKTCTDIYPSKCRLGCTRSRPSQMNEPEVTAVIELANTATLMELDDVVGLDARAARNIVSRRDELGPFETIDQLDDISYVAETAFGKMLSYAYAQGIVTDTQLHFCDMTSFASPDASGNYAYEPAPGWDGTDAFVEVNLFHHLNLVDDTVRSWGFAGLGQQVQVIGNYRDADEYDPLSRECRDGAFVGQQELALVENAWFAPSQLAGDPVLVFGQGESVDWGLDADIIYHEYGHAVMYAVAPDVGDGTWDDYGFNRGQAGLHEGYADLLALWMSGGDPALAEYVASSWGDAALRDWSKPARCPDDMTGEEHDDGLILPSAIWHAREAISPAAREAFDESAFIVWQSLGANDGLRSTVARIVAEFASVRPEDAEVARAVFDEFFTTDCISRTVNAWDARDLAIQGNDYYDVVPYGVPHTLQWRATIASSATEITFASTSVDPTDPANPTDMTLFMKYGDEPIQWWDDDDGYVNDAEVSASVQVREDGVAITTITGEFEPGTYTFALSNRGGSAYLWGSSFDTDGEGVKSDEASPDLVDDDSGCSTTGDAPLGVIGLFAMVVARLRRK